MAGKNGTTNRNMKNSGPIISFPFKGPLEQVIAPFFYELGEIDLFGNF